MKTVNRTIRLAHLQAVMTAGVVASFVVVNVVGLHHAASIDRDADAIVGNALPGIEDLGEARGAVRRLDVAAGKWINLAWQGRAPPLDSLDGFVDDIEGLLSRYRTFAMGPPNESAIFMGARAQVTAVETSARREADALRLGDRAGAEAALCGEQHSAALADVELHRLLALHMTAAADLGRDVAAVRHSTRRIVIALTCVAVTLAALATALSIAALRRSMSVLQQARALAEHKSIELDRFAGRVAHDILSPLGAVRLSVDLLARRVRGDDVANGALQRASRSVDRVRTLVDGLLDYARAAAQPSPGASAKVDVVVQDVLDGLRSEAEERGIHLDMEGVQEVRVASTVGVLTSLVSNLVRNAIKYLGDQPRRVVTVRTVTSDQRVRIEVHDTGPGVAAAIADSIFEPFVRGVSDKNGIGLGLATVRQLTRAHGGTCGMHSAAGGGSLFWFELPRAVTSDKAHNA